MRIIHGHAQNALKYGGKTKIAPKFFKSLMLCDITGSLQRRKRGKRKEEVTNIQSEKDPKATRLYCTNVQILPQKHRILQAASLGLSSASEDSERVRWITGRALMSRGQGLVASLLRQ